MTSWHTVGEAGERFREAVKSQSGWYWLLRPHQEGPGRYDGTKPVVCPIHVFEDGRVSSPLADLRGLGEDQLSPRDARGVRYPSYFAGPVEPGEPSGALRVERTAEGYHVDGEPPAVPGWYWCRTNAEAPLLHVDENGIGPIYLDRAEGGAIHVWSTATLSGQPVDVGELGFSEPLTSEGGVIDESGELGRMAVEFFGALAVPPSPPPPLWREEISSRPPRLALREGRTTLRVADLARARAFYEKLGFSVRATRAEEGWAELVGGGLELRLVTGRGAALHFTSDDTAREALVGLGLDPEADPDGLVLTDPDGHRIVIRAPT